MLFDGIEKKRISIITLTYNELETATKPFIKSLYECTELNDFELIIIDNASKDGTVEYLKEIKQRFNNIAVIFNEINTGYSCGNNAGLKIAKGDYIILANNDILFTDNWLYTLLAPFNDPRVGCVSPLTNFCGHSEQLLPIKVTTDDYKENFKNYMEKKRGCNYQLTNRVIFFCVAITRQIFEEVGYLDESFSPAWYEDDDYCARINKIGRKIAIATHCFIFHNHSQSTSKISNKVSTELFARNRKFFEEKHKDFLIQNEIKRTPIFIISFNRLDCLKKLINWLEQAGLENIIILDNNSTYPPLVEYLNSLPYKTVFLDHNYGFTALWDCHLFDQLIMTTFFILTDPDILPINECPFDVIEHFLKIIKTYPKVDKVGFSLKIDDLPNAYPNKKLVVQWESRYTKKISQTPLLFDAQIDTTFALYRPNRITPFNRIGRGIRTGFPYTARHLPWYSVKETEEDQYYKSHQNGGASWFQPDDYVKIIQDAQKQRKHIIANKIYCLLVSKKILLPLKILLSFLPQKTKKRIVRILIGNPH